MSQAKFIGRLRAIRIDPTLTDRVPPVLLKMVQQEEMFLDNDRIRHGNMKLAIGDSVEEVTELLRREYVERFNIIVREWATRAVIVSTIGGVDTLLTIVEALEFIVDTNEVTDGLAYEGFGFSVYKWQPLNNPFTGC